MRKETEKLIKLRTARNEIRAFLRINDTPERMRLLQMTHQRKTAELNHGLRLARMDAYQFVKSSHRSKKYARRPF
jgi:hypothetical protein